MATHTRNDTEHVAPAVVHRHPVTTFVAMTFAVSWALWLPLVLLPERIPPAVAFLLTLLGSLVPSTVALVLVARLHGRDEARRLLRRLVMAHVRIGWYAAILALTALMLLAAWVSTLIGVPAPVVVATIPAAVFLFLFSIFPGSAVGEEIGWRGYALPYLQSGHSALAASLILGAIWGIYHLPLFLIGSPLRPIGLFIPFALSCVIMSIFYTWMYNGTGGSLFVAVLLHASSNLPLTIVYTAFGDWVVPVFWLFDAMLTLAAIALIARTGAATLSRQHIKQTLTP